MGHSWLAILAYAGPYGILLAGADRLHLGLQWLAPTWIMPLFNTFTPLELGVERCHLDARPHRQSLPEDVFVIDGSRRSGKSNAFYWLWEAQAYRAFDTLIASHTVSELVAVLAHEMAIIK